MLYADGSRRKRSFFFTGLGGASSVSQLNLRIAR
jgi:hypothetical protein